MNAESYCPVDVSVLVPTYNCRAYLDRCLVSLLIQRVSMEIIVVDDGSSDDTRTLLDLYQAHHRIKVVYQEHSGTAGSPRNRALDLAQGRYVFFCDADDYLEPDALQRMLAMADRNGSDIVLGKIVGHGRKAPVSMFRESADLVTLRDSAIYNSLACFKLFRRAMLEQHRIRFDDALRVGEDMVFTAHAYCHADVISVVADSCYHLVARPDGSSVMQEAGSRDPLGWLRMVRIPIELMARHVPAGPLRDRLLLRHFRFDVFSQLGAPLLAADEAAREKIVIEVADICSEWLTDGVRGRLSAADRLRATSLRDLDPLDGLVRLAGVEAAQVCHRLTGLEWDSDRLIVSGRASLAGFDGAVSLLLRERVSSAEKQVPVTRVADMFSTAIDVTALPAGVWDVYAAVECEGVRRLARFGAERAPGARVPDPRFTSGIVALPYLTRTHGNLSVDVGGHVVRVPGSVRLTRTEWAGSRLRVVGQVIVGNGPGAAAVRHLIWRERHSGWERREAVTATGSGTFVAETEPFGPGTWDAYLELDVGGPPARFPIKVGGPETLGQGLRWWRGRVRWTARPYATAVNRRLSTSVRRDTPSTILRRVLQRILHKFR